MFVEDGVLLEGLVSCDGGEGLVFAVVEEGEFVPLVVLVHFEYYSNYYISPVLRLLLPFTTHPPTTASQ